MTEDVLNAAILRMRAKALENFALIKDLYHRPATRETVDQICSLSLALAQYEGAMITLQQYAANLSSLTENEKKHTIVEMQKEVEEPEAEEPDELEDPEEPDKKVLSGEELAKRSPTNRRTSARSKRAKSKTKEEE
tara:strand:- start:4596 stop:5003 length:408 start_codon:yes stop_codon:yes gene_type:complete